MNELYSLKGFSCSPELRLILACLRLKPDEKEVQQIAELSRAPINWPKFLQWVDRHLVTPLVYQNLKSYCKKSVPVSVVSALRSRFERNAQRGLANAAELVRLYNLFQENGISVLPLKGSTLALRCNNNLAWRHAGDIDLLVEPSQVELADHLLQKSYRRTIPVFGLTPAQRRRFLRRMHHFCYLHNQGNLRVELHWRPTHDQPTHAMALNRLHRRAATVVVAGYQLPMLALPDNIIYLCGHGGVHFWYRLFWLVDLSEIMRGDPQIDWQHLTTLAREASLMRSLAWGVILAHILLDAPMPEVIRTYALQDRLVPDLVKVAYQSMLCMRPENLPIALNLQGIACRIRGANSFKEKIEIIQEVVIGEDWMTIDLPDSLFFLHYFLRLPLFLQRRLHNSRKFTGLKHKHG